MELLSRESLRIVHVDADQDFVELNERSLICAGFKKPVVRCIDGQTAINYLLKTDLDSAPHVILVDLHMPRMSGLVVLHWLRTNYREREVAVYLLTSCDDPNIINRRPCEGGAEYVPKGGIVDHLLRKLDDLINTKNETALKNSGQEQYDSLNGNTSFTRTPETITNGRSCNNYNTPDSSSLRITSRLPPL